MGAVINNGGLIDTRRARRYSGPTGRYSPQSVTRASNLGLYAVISGERSVPEETAVKKAGAKYSCSICGGTVVVLKVGEGELQCHDQPMGTA
jgi:desulfoferrodoxin-like iron-binding protein